MIKYVDEYACDLKNEIQCC